jgi:hypothetical protein
MALTRAQLAQDGESTVIPAVADTAVAPEAVPLPPYEEPGPRYDSPPVPAPPPLAPWMRPVEPALVAVGPQVAPGAVMPGWTSGFLALCGVAALLVGALVGYLVVQLVLAG